MFNYAAFQLNFQKIQGEFEHSDIGAHFVVKQSVGDVWRHVLAEFIQSLYFQSSLELMLAQDNDNS